MIPTVVNIARASYLAGYKLQLEFDDGTRQLVDFEPFLRRAVHPDTRAFLDVERFRAFRVEFGNLVWGDHELCFPIADLYANQIDKQAILEGQA